MRELDETELLDRASTAAALRLGPGTAVSRLRPLPGGVSSLTFLAEVRMPHGEAREVVLKVAPPGLPPVRHRDVLRQASLMARLAAHARASEPAAQVPVPDVVFEQDGDPPFFAMDKLPGVAEEPAVDDPEVPATAEVVQARALAAARVLARMQQLSLSDLGLDQEETITAGQELDRWSELMDTVDDDLCPGHEELRGALRHSIPEPVSPVLLHGDFRLGNLIFDGSRFVGVIDWEIWSVGDPRSDLAWLVMNSRPAHRLRATRSDAAAAAAAAMPTAAALVAEHQAYGGPAAGELAWFVACCLYKTASTLGAVAKRDRRAGRNDPDRLAMRESLPSVVELGLAVVKNGLGVLDRS
jgi:aminoglycoside phosphotransferase (APT) family kinase protein